MRAVDDDDGNLANGTPHSCHLYAAFNRHVIACTTDAGADTNYAGCTQPAAPVSVADRRQQPGPRVNWSGSTGYVYDVYRTEDGCDSGFVKIAEDADRLVARRHRRRQRLHLLLPGHRAAERQRGLLVGAVDLRVGHPRGAPCTPPCGAHRPEPGGHRRTTRSTSPGARWPAPPSTASTGPATWRPVHPGRHSTPPTTTYSDTRPSPAARPTTTWSAPTSTASRPTRPRHRKPRPASAPCRPPLPASSR